MILKKERTLKNKLFTTNISFVAYGKRDDSEVIDKELAAQEEKIVDDFGAPLILTGGQFSGIVKIVDRKVILVKVFDTSEELKSYEKQAGEEAVEFILTNTKVELKSGFETSFTADATKTNAVGTLTPEQVAEAKCLIFEKLIQKRAQELIEAYKEKLTDFETGLANTNAEEFTIPILTE